MELNSFVSPTNMNENDIQIRKLNTNHYEEIKPIINNLWGSEKMITRGKMHYLDKLPGLIAIYNNKIVGFLIYRIENDECEIMALNSLKENVGIATLLIKKIEKISNSLGYKTISVSTTNDNKGALHFYQKTGFKISRIDINAMKKARQLKPEIPYVGMNGIPIRDEIILKKSLVNK